MDTSCIISVPISIPSVRLVDDWDLCMRSAILSAAVILPCLDPKRELLLMSRMDCTGLPHRNDVIVYQNPSLKCSVYLTSFSLALENLARPFSPLTILVAINASSTRGCSDVSGNSYPPSLYRVSLTMRIPSVTPGVALVGSVFIRFSTVPPLL